jgi:hypothetical protein
MAASSPRVTGAVSPDATVVGAGEPVRSADVYLEPSDRSTSVGSSSIQLVAMNLRPIADETIAALSQGLLLEVWPEGDIVPFTTSAARAAGDDGWYRVTLSVMPSSPLSDRWYALHAQTEVLAANFATSPGNWKDPKGGWMSRFRPGPETVISYVQRGEKETLTAFYLGFSEQVGIKPDTPADKVLLIRSGSKTYECRAQNLPQPGETLKEIIVYCDGPEIVPLELSIDILDVFTTSISPTSISIGMTDYGSDGITVHP